MPAFKVHAPYQPMGDQPRAIEQLVEGIQRGMRHQTLLGATGTGKSLGYHDPVFIVEQHGAEQIPQVVPIGELIDGLLEYNAEAIRYSGDTAIIDTDALPAQYYTQSFNPETCEVELAPVSAFTRHDAPAAMYRLQTACGREVTLTGDHNLWVLRDGRMQLIETADARTTDYLPLPEMLLGAGALQQPPVLSATGLFNIREPLLTYSNPATAMVLEAQSDRLTLEAEPLPSFWPQLSSAALAELLRDYCDEHAAIERAGAITITTAGKDHASDLAYALLRFGIWAQIKQEHDYTIAIAGPVNLRRFERTIGFRLTYKQDILDDLLAAERATIAEIDGVHVYWTAIEHVERIAYAHPHVYDLSVPGNETFLAGSGGLFVHNTFVMAKIAEATQRPTLVLAHNKTLAAQLYAEFKEFFPENAVAYFVSYYDQYTPEAYVPSKDLYIEKEASINEEIDRLRHEATQALLTRRDTLIVASVSAIFGLGAPADYGQVAIPLKTGEVRNRDKLLRQLIDLQFERNDMDFHRGTFRVRGDTVEVFPVNAEIALRIEFWGDEIERIVEVDPLTGEILVEKKAVEIYPAKHFITSQDKIQLAIRDIEQELEMQLKYLEDQGRQLEAQRLKQRTMYDLEMLGEMGYCSGIENYSRHLDRRLAGQTPWTLLDYFPDDYLMFIDESHITLPQVRGMFKGDRSRKETLVEYGFRLPSALDNRPLQWDEFDTHIHQAIYVSATPAQMELERSEQVVEQIIRPTGLLDPIIHVRPTRGQIDDLMGEIRKRVDNGQRALVTTLTKRMAEDLADYLKEMGVRTQYLHADIETLERVEILRDLRMGVYDVVVGINLLREGLDLPEVSLVAILDADKEGYLRSASSLIQIIGRAARHVEGTVLMYADTRTASMDAAIRETERRRAIQEAYNRERGIEPQTIVKQIRDLTDRLQHVAEEKADYQTGHVVLAKDELLKLIKDVEKQMKDAARNLEFEKAALLRDQLIELRRTLALEGEDALLESVAPGRARPTPAAPPKVSSGTPGRKRRR